MAMLAEPRRKQKVINLRAKNSAWSNDANKFGQRMLEKMGWSSGKGLGAKENGIVEHVVAKYKNDDKGLGYEDKNDQWTKHEDDFNSLLANLSSGVTSDEKLHSGISLEDKSKKSKARVHYHKFTRGKDLTKYSEKDLANIFGKKSFKNEESRKEIIDDNIKVTEQVFTEKGSMEDYFKNKLATFKSKNKLNYKSHSENNDCENDYSFKGFSGTTDEIESDDHQSFSFQSFLTYNNESVAPKTESIEDNSLENTKKSKKKKKKEKQKEEISIESNFNSGISQDCEINYENNSLENTKKSKKKKKKEKQNEELLIESNSNSGMSQDCEINNENNSNIKEENIKTNKKKSKRKKRKSNSESEVIEAKNSKTMEECQTVEDYHVPKKKKKRK